MGIIQSVISFWLDKSKFLNEYKKYYDSHHIKKRDKECDCESIWNRLTNLLEHTGIDENDTYYVDSGFDRSPLFYDIFKVGYYITANNNGFRLVLSVEYKGEKYTAPINDILNNHIKSDYFNDNIFAYDERIFDENVSTDSMKLGDIILSSMAVLQKYSGMYINKQMYSFFTETKFIEEFIELSRICDRNEKLCNTYYKPDKKDVLDILSECGYDGKYHHKENFYNIEKHSADITIGYNIWIKSGIIICIPYGIKGNEGIFFAPSMESFIMLFSNEKIVPLRCYSLDELKTCLSFMIKYLDILTSFFDGTYEK